MASSKRKVTGGIYTRELAGYWVIAADVTISHRVGVIVFYHKAENFALEELRLYGTNVASFQLVSGGQQWNVLGCYIAWGNVLIIDSTVATTSQLH